MMIARNQLATTMHSCCRQFIAASAFGFTVVWLVTVAAGQASSNLPNQWVGLESRETNDGPTLVVTPDAGEAKTYTAVADTVLISYLADRGWGRMRLLSISVSDTNRILLRFDPVEGVAVRRAELVLKLGKSPAPPTQSFDVGVYEVKAEWDEHRVTWANQPKIADEPAAKGSFDPKAGEFRVDVTALVKRHGEPAKGGGEKDAPKHGWLLKVTKPLVGGPAGPVNDLGLDLLTLLPWAESVDDAMKSAGENKKLVLACVRPAYDDRQINVNEQLLLATALADADVLALVQSRFIPVRLALNPGAYLHATPGRPLPGDPLVRLGTNALDCKPLALLVATPEGKPLAKLTNIGTFDRDLTLRFLLAALAKQNDAAVGTDPWALLAAGYLEAAEQRFAEMDSREGRYGLSRVASFSGNYAKALALAQPLAHSEGLFQDEARFEAAHALMRLGRFDEARSGFQAVVDGPAGARSAQSAYFLGCMLARLGEAAKAKAVWRELTKPSDPPSIIRAKARLTWPTLLASCECLTPATSHGEIGTTEVDWTGQEDALVRQALTFLMSQQQPVGTWSSGQNEMWQAAVTALAARSLHKWGTLLNDDLGKRAVAAAANATRWLDRQVGEVDPQAMETFGATYLLDYFLDLDESKAAVRGDTQGAVKLLLAAQCKNGGWSYSYRFAVNWRGGKGSWPKTDLGREHSMNTGPALVALARAKEQGLLVPAEVLEKGRKALESMRAAAGAYTYTFPEPRNFTQPSQSVGRACGCEHALRKLGGSSTADLEATIVLFMKHRVDLRAPVKLTEAWTSRHNYSSYFYHFAYDHAARAIIDHGESVPERLGQIRSDLLRVAEADGTWIDFETIGKPYGTAMALHTLFLTRLHGPGERMN
jgi:tetratricopeptide (TPR) repeat protein